MSLGNPFVSEWEWYHSDVAVASQSLDVNGPLVLHVTAHLNCEILNMLNWDYLGIFSQKRYTETQISQEFLFTYVMSSVWDLLHLVPTTWACNVTFLVSLSRPILYLVLPRGLHVIAHQKTQPFCSCSISVFNVTCHETLDAGYQCVCHLDNGRIVPVNGTRCVGAHIDHRSTLLSRYKFISKGELAWVIIIL